MADRIETLTPQEAGKMMGLGAETVQYGLKQGRFPWGYAIQTGKTSWRYWINKRKFMEIEGVEKYGEKDHLSIGPDQRTA